MRLPPAIQAYFEADGQSDSRAVSNCFVPDAIVSDEGRSHSGHDAIGRWWQDAKAKYRHVAVPLETSDHDPVIKVRARVTGAFPGSPATLTFAFRLANEKIAALEIGA